MNTVILNSIQSDDKLYNILKSFLFEELSKAGFKNEFIDLFSKNIEYCNGCGYCGEKKVGVCVKKDDMTEIYYELANSKIYIFISPITFGGFNSELKKAIDRISPLGVSGYTIYKGELHHPMRYDNPKMFFTIGILDNDYPEQEETFKLVSERLEKAFFSPKTASLVLNKDMNVDSIQLKIKESLEKLGVIS